MKTTEMELKVMEVIKENMDMYGDGFSDIMVKNIVLKTSFKTNQVKGILGSLEKKSFICLSDVNGKYNVYSLTREGFEALGYQPDYI